MNKIKEFLQNNKKRLIISLSLTVIMCIFSITYIQPQIFEDNFGAVYILVQIVFAFCIFLFLNFLITFINKLRNGDEEYKIWLLNFAIYFAIMFIFLILIWPGRWVWDEFKTLPYAINYQIDIWQSYLTVLFMSIGMMIFPSPVAIVVVQTVLLSLVFSYLSTKVYMKYKKKILNIILYLFMLTPVLIINNLYPLRLTMYSYVMMLAFAILIFDKIDKNKLTLLKVFKLFLLTILLILWRSEGMIFIILMPGLMLLVYNKNGMNILKATALVIASFVVFFIYSKTINKAGVNEEYGLTIYINPLSEVLQADLKGKNAEKNVQEMDKVMDMELLKEYHGYIDIGAYWMCDNLVREGFQEHMADFRKNYIELVLNNLGTFLEARTKTFLATSCMYEGYSGNMESRLLNYLKGSYISPDETKMMEDFLNNYKFTKPINKNIKVKLESLLIGKKLSTDKYRIRYGQVVWNVLPVLILLVICGIWGLIKKNWLYLGIYISLLGSATIIFLTAPANFFMYYLPIYICGTIFSILFIVERILEKKHKMIKDN